MPKMSRKKRNSDVRTIGQMCLKIFGNDDEKTKTVFIEAFGEMFNKMNEMKTFQKPELCRKQRIQILRETWDILENHKEDLSTLSWMNASIFFRDHYNRMNYKNILL